MRLPFGHRFTLCRLTAFAVAIACALSAERGYAADATAATATDTNLVEIVVTPSGVRKTFKMSQPPSVPIPAPILPMRWRTKLPISSSIRPT